MKNLLLFAFLSVAVLLHSGCASKLMSFEKRKYTKGYHIDLAGKKDKKNKEYKAESTASINAKEPKQIINKNSETTCQSLPEIYTDILVAETVTAKPYKTENSNTKNNFFQNQILKNFKGSTIKATAKHSAGKLFSTNNTAGISQTADMNIFTIVGAIIAGGCLVALTVMLFSSWASVLLLILFVSGCFFGLALLIVGANW